MPKSLCLSLGEFFAEVSLKEVGPKLNTTRSARWPTSKSSLEKGLQSFLADTDVSEIEEVQINLPVLESLLRKRLGNPPAFLTTEGFENWLEMNLPVSPSHFCLKPKRVKSPLDNDLIFGISERLTSEGKVSKALDVTEIDFLASKLKMNEVKWVALGLLHSDQNPEHEVKIAEGLKAQEFQVVMSSSFKADSERPRWWASVLTAYLAPLIEEQCAEIKKTLEALNLKTEPQYWTNKGLKSQWPIEDSLELLFGSSYILKKWCEKNSLPGALYLDVEGFYLQDLTTGSSLQQSSSWVSEFGPVAFESASWKKLKIQPTSLVEASWLGGLDVGSTEVGFEPGPISMGRGLVPCFIDSFKLSQAGEKVLGFSEFVQAKSSGRISEAVSTLARNLSNSEWRDVNDLIADLCNLGVRQILREYVYPLGTEVFLTGGMAPLIYKKIQKLPGLPVKVQCTPSVLSELALEGQQL